MKHYIAEKWRDILVFNDLDTHEKIWALEAEWFEEPNHRRGGWSGVSRIELKLPLGGVVAVFLKRQEDHVTRTFSHPFKGVATFAREYDVITEFQQRKIPSLDLVFFEQWMEQGHQRAVILTEELAGYMPLSSAEYHQGSAVFSNKASKKALFTQLTGLMQAMHQHNFQHNCFYPKHVFVKQLSETEFDLRVIDLEKVKKLLCRKAARFRDLSTLLRHSTGWTEEDKLEFFRVYCGEEQLSRRSKRLWAKLNAAIEKKKASAQRP